MTKQQFNEFDVAVVHYDEIGLKGNNRATFERILVKNIKQKLGSLIDGAERDHGHITVMLGNRQSSEEIKQIRETLLLTPGIAFFSFAKRCELDIKKMQKAAVEFLEGREFSTFKVDTDRHNKNFKRTSLELNNLVGQAIVDAYGKHGKKVKLKNPDITLKLEISNKSAYLSCENIDGVAGFPVDRRQKVVVLLSGGFDSPVAAHMMMKRGCETILAHFKNQNQQAGMVEDKIIKLAKQLSKSQPKTTLYIIPFEKIQKEIIMKAQADLRMLVYRRFMIKIASKIAYKNKAKFLVVGDSLSQVASQTIENLESTYHGAEKHILSPLIGMNKREIIAISKKIGTYDISVQPYGDCCSYFLPKHPMLRATKEMLKKIEDEFDADALVDDAVKNSDVKVFG